MPGSTIFVPVSFLDREAAAAASSPPPVGSTTTSGGPALARQSSQRNSVTTLPRREVLHLTGQARRTIVHKCTALFTDVPYLRGATKSVADYLGPVIPDPATTDTKWNQRAKEWFAEMFLKSTRWDATQKFSFTAWQEMLQIYTDRDGDCLVAFTEDETGMPCHRLIPALAIDDPAGMNTLEGRWRDGVLLGPHHRHQAYHVLAEEDTPERLTSAMRAGYVIPAARCALSANFDAVGHARGTTRFIASGNTIIDMQMMDASTHQLFNLASKIGLTISSTADGTPPIIKGVQGRVFGRTEAAESGSGGPTFDVVGYTEKFMEEGPVAARLDPGQSLNLHNLDRDLPDVSAIRGSDFERIAMAYGLPVQTLFCIYSGLFNLTGPGFRVSMAKSRQWRERQLEKREPLMTRAYARIIEWAIRTGELPRPEGDTRWWKCVTRYTRDYTIDEARDVRSDELRVRMGITSVQELCREYGRDFDEVWGEQLEAIRKIYESMTGQPLKPGDGLPLNLAPMFAGWKPVASNPAARDKDSPDAPDSDSDAAPAAPAK